MTNTIAIFVTIFLAGMGVFGDYFIKLSSQHKQIISLPFMIGTITYALTAVGWFYVMKYIKLGILGIFYTLTTTILLIIVGSIFFKEQLSQIDIIGIILGITSIIILARFD